MEVWGDAILKAGGRDWSVIKDGKRARSSSNWGLQSLCSRHPFVQPEGDKPSNDGGRAQYRAQGGRSDQAR